ncbi:hypothetical protein FRB97_002575 [Tulasnella sp. 331]|nr:hypothetical protein FRB97_002575 [Tulasnella sp. 331]
MHPNNLAALIVLFVTSVVSVSAIQNPFGKRQTLPPLENTAASSGATITAVTNLFFDQLIDHNNPSAGTFKQRYFFYGEYYTGEGAPVVLMNPGEQAADGFQGYLTSNVSIQNAIMKTIGGAGVILEHRYWGLSSPYEVLTTQNLTYLTVTQAIEDTVYFVENVKLPLNVSNTHPGVTPWVDMGCSYPGLLSAYTQEKHSDTFAAAWASSAPVEAISDFWEYFEPIEEGMPKNCSADVALAIQAVDQILLHGTNATKNSLKESFGLAGLHDDDFADALPSAIYVWQDQSASDYANIGADLFYQFCDAIETLPNNKTNMAAKGVGMPYALENYASFFKANLGCGGDDSSCYSSYDYTAEFYTNKTVDNPYDLQWYWMICTEFGWWQDGDAGNSSSIVSSIVTPAYWQRQCDHLFPINGKLSNYAPAIAQNNAIYDGWKLKANNLFVVNGQYDPWRSASLSSNWAPKSQNTETQQIQIVAGGHHCWDWIISDALYDPDIKRVVDIGVAQQKAWVKQWYAAHPMVKDAMPLSVDIWEYITLS